MTVTSYSEFVERYLPDTFEASLTDEERGRRAVARALKRVLSDSSASDAETAGPSK